ncbi:DUF1428 domain-containing protein [Candidatus Peregrinibacteria bacterium CG10_big_fil_rev_8_21_14_0_10_49_16]|nr:MAG: DUF1428 domain-containing protein [Candidatus Peregrinibacteria bacterium CG10_big_fil_rev_8_21_14_0_10_49_16]
MRYVDGYVLPVPKNKLDTYRKMAKQAAKVWMKHGALEYVEAVGDDLTSVHEWHGMPFPDMAKAKKTETVIFAFIIYKSRKHRDQVNKKVMAEFSAYMKKKKKKPAMPFDMKRMAYGGFKAIVDVVAEK